MDVAQGSHSATAESRGTVGRRCLAGQSETDAPLPVVRGGGINGRLMRDKRGQNAGEGVGQDQEGRPWNREKWQPECFGVTYLAEASSQRRLGGSLALLLCNTFFFCNL